MPKIMHESMIWSISYTYYNFTLKHDVLYVVYSTINITIIFNVRRLHIWIFCYYKINRQIKKNIYCNHTKWITQVLKQKRHNCSTKQKAFVNGCVFIAFYLYESSILPFAFVFYIQNTQFIDNLTLTFNNQNQMKYCIRDFARNIAYSFWNISTIKGEAIEDLLKRLGYIQSTQAALLCSYSRALEFCIANLCSC